jgi:hypothetical protein
MAVVVGEIDHGHTAVPDLPLERVAAFKGDLETV